MTELEMQKILAVIAHSAHLQRSRAIKQGMRRVRTKNGTVIAYEVDRNGKYVSLGRISNAKATV